MYAAPLQPSPMEDKGTGFSFLWINNAFHAVVFLSWIYNLGWKIRVLGCQESSSLNARPSVHGINES